MMMREKQRKRQRLALLRTLFSDLPKEEEASPILKKYKHLIFSTRSKDGLTEARMNLI